MTISDRLSSLSFVQSFQTLKGNTRTTVIFEIVYGIANVLYSFYLSLYMKGQGITDTQIGYIISIGFISSAVFALFGGVVTNKLGRKKTTTIFELIAWPLSIIIYLLSTNFWMFVLARTINSMNQISMVAWNMMIIEDADDTQRINAYNLLTIIHTATGIITPIGGFIVAAYGIIKAEKIFMIFAAVCMLISMILRNKFYTETKIGQKVLSEGGDYRLSGVLKGVLQKDAIKALIKNPSLIMIVSVYIIYRMYYSIGSLLSLYFAVYLTEVLKINESIISVFGGINSFVLLLLCVFITPQITRRLESKAMIAKVLMVGFLFQIAYAVLMVVMPVNNLVFVTLAIVLYGIGFGLGRTYSDSMLASSTEQVAADRAGVYSLVNTAVSFSSIIMGSVSGFLYVLNPHLIYIITIGMLTINVIILLFYAKRPENLELETNG